MAEEKKPTPGEEKEEPTKEAVDNKKDEKPATEAKEEEKKTEEKDPKKDEKTAPEAKKEEKDLKKEESDDKEEVEVPEKFKNLVEKIENLSVLELSELVKVLEKKLGVSASAPVTVAAGGVPASAGEAEGEAEEKSDYNIELKAVGDSKIEVIKAVRTITGKGLKEAKDMVDAAANEPQIIKESVPAEDAKEAEKSLKEAGAQVELK